MNQKWWSFLLGFVRINIKGSQLEKFINMAGGRGIPLWDLRRNKDSSITARVRLDGFRSLRHVAKNTNSKIQITGKSGMPFFVSRMKRQRALLAGVITFFLMLYALSTFIWTVEVKGTELVDKKQILSLAQDNGLASGSWRPFVDTGLTERAILQNVSDVEWVGVKLRGTKAVIEVEEKIKVRRQVEKGPSNLVASKSGTIYRLMVLRGEGRVKEGAQVQAGEVLVSGIIVPPPLPGTSPAQAGVKQPQTPVAPPELVQAKGEAWAYVWYHAEAEVQFLEEGMEETGQTLAQWRIKMPKGAILIRGPQKIPFEHARYETFVKPLVSWRNIQLPVEIERVDYHELQPYRIKRDSKQALADAQERAREAVRAQLPEGVKVTKVMVLPQATSSDRVKVRVSVETLENIAVAQEIQ